MTDSILGLVESGASAIQLNLVFVSAASASPLFNTTVTRLLVWAIVLLHGIADVIGVSCTLEDVTKSFITWINMINSSQIPGIL